MTDTTGGWLGPLTDHAWWNGALRRTIRTIWHFVGCYAAVGRPITALIDAWTIGSAPTVGPVSVAVAASAGVAGALAGLLSALRPGISAARTLAFGGVATVSFGVVTTVVAQPQPAGRPLVVLDVALAAVSTLLLSAVAAYGFDQSDLPIGAAAD